MAQSSYQKIILTEDLELSWPFSYTGTTIVCDINDIASDDDDRKIILPAANLTGVGQNFIFNNISDNDFTIVANDGTTTLATISAGEVKQFYLIKTDTATGEWSTIAYSGGTGGIVTITTKSSDSSLIINNSNTATISGTGGTVDFKLPESLVSFNQISNPGGFPVIISNDPFTWVTVDLVAGENIKITNPDGIDGDPVIALSGTVTGLASIEVGNMTLSGEVITNNVADRDISLNTSGSGKVYINGLSIASDGLIEGANIFSSPMLPKAYCTFDDTITGSTNTIAIRDQGNVRSVMGSAGTYHIEFIEPLNNDNYGVIITLGSTGGELPFISNAYYTVKQTGFVTIVVTNASGELVSAAPHGVTVMIMAASLE
jgi:hypothetical protein